ncbi:MAG TPA: hypothetical protein VFO67_01190 [Gemmatimonadales bacterium]|nr:hypothetical protein [Gemmatimonadales bacterium]
MLGQNGEGAREEPGVPGKGEAVAGMTEAMMGRCQCAKMMSHMMAACCAAQDAKEQTATEASQKA